MYGTLLYSVDGAIATITLNRPKELNTDPPMPDELEPAINAAVRIKTVAPSGTISGRNNSSLLPLHSLPYSRIWARRRTVRRQ